VTDTRGAHGGDDKVIPPQISRLPMRPFAVTPQLLRTTIELPLALLEEYRLPLCVASEGEFMVAVEKVMRSECRTLVG
jgi:hypothetical protein